MHRVCAREYIYNHDYQIVCKAKHRGLAQHFSHYYERMSFFSCSLRVHWLHASRLFCSPTISFFRFTLEERSFLYARFVLFARQSLAYLLCVLKYSESISEFVVFCFVYDVRKNELQFYGTLVREQNQCFHVFNWDFTRAVLYNLARMQRTHVL